MNISELDAYFDRIGYEGPRSADPDVLKKLHLFHPKSIPFENLNPLLGIPVDLDPDAIQQKLVHNGRGGYCFEQNLLFKQVLETLGFKVKGLAARILWNRPEDSITPRGHMLLLVIMKKHQYIADVGFGGLGPTAPLLLKPDIVQKTPHENYKLKQRNKEYILYSDVKGEWKALYRFNLQEHYRQDYEITNWYLSNHPKSHFVTGLIAARPEINPNRRYALQGNQLSVHTFEKGTEKQEFNTASELRDILQDIFLIKLPDHSTLDETFENIIRQEEADK